MYKEDRNISDHKYETGPVDCLLKLAKTGYLPVVISRMSVFYMRFEILNNVLLLEHNPVDYTHY